jgi:hypothetical protein
MLFLLVCGRGIFFGNIPQNIAIGMMRAVDGAPRSSWSILAGALAPAKIDDPARPVARHHGRFAQRNGTKTYRAIHSYIAIVPERAGRRQEG